jgi:predicted lactoylglutathione lyase
LLLTEPFFQTFTKKEIIDAHKAVECSIALSADSKDAVNEMVDKAAAAGATIPNPATDYGFMYQHSFEYLDGHHWEFVWMDPKGVPEHQE